MEIQQYLMETLRSQYSAEDMDRILYGFSVRRRSSLRVNRLRAQQKEVMEALKAAGISFETVPFYEDALVFPQEQESLLRTLPLYTEGLIYLQNLSSMIPPLLLAPEPEENILDMAAAPGGKTTMMSALTGNRALITACEVHGERAERLRFNLNRQGATRVTVMNRDARTLEDFYKFDRVLVDAPCSGSGTVSAESRGTFSEANLKKCCKRQRELISHGLRLLQPGHLLVYSTCSILCAENEQIIEGAVRQGAEIVPIPMDRFPGVPQLPTQLPGTLCVCPDERFEGFFTACLRRKR